MKKTTFELDRFYDLKRPRHHFMIFVFALIALNLIATDLFGIVWMLL